MSEPIQIAVIAFAAAILGGLMQSVVAWVVAARQFRWQTNRDNYVLFLQAITQMGLHAKDGPEWETARKILLEAIARMLLQGSPRVVRLVAAYQDHDGLVSNEGKEAFSKLVGAMRDDIGGEKMREFPSLARRALLKEGRQ